MKYCSKCGKELRDEAVVCVGCGCPVPITSASNNHNTPAGENPTIANLAVAFAFLIPIAGFVLGLIGMSKYQDPVLRNRAKSGLLFSLAVFIICFTILCVFMQI